MELHDDNMIILADKDVNNNDQMWTRRSVDELENWFIWSNSEVTEEKFLSAPDNENLIMKGTS